MSNHPVVAIVGSGPIGATFARLICEGVPHVTVHMFEAGPTLTEIPGESVRNVPDPAAKARARELSQGPQAGSLRTELGIPESVVAEGMFTARQGTHLFDFGGEGAAECAQFPAAAGSTNVGGQGAHWTCAVPRPSFSERVPFIDDVEWDDLIERAEELLSVQHEAFGDSPVGVAIRALLHEEFGGELPDGYGVGTLPVSGRPTEDGGMRWGGTDFILEPLLGEDTPHGERFFLHDLSFVRQVLTDGNRAVGVLVDDLRSGQSARIDADIVIVAADAFRSPQLLWASGVRPPALGRFLTEHPVVIAPVALDADKMARFASVEQLREELARRAANAVDPVAAVNRIPYSEPDHPYSLQVMFTERMPFTLPDDHPGAGNEWGYVNMGYGIRKHPRIEDGLSFTDDLDYRGMPNFRVEYELTDRELADIAEVKERLVRAGRALGEFIAEPRLLPNGSSLHYMGTLRMGATDDGTSVVDADSRVWGYENLVVGGNAVIPTANTMNPTLTSVAIAIKAARRIVESVA